MVDAFPAEGVGALTGVAGARGKYDILMDPFMGMQFVPI